MRQDAKIIRGGDANAGITVINAQRGMEWRLSVDS